MQNEIFGTIEGTQHGDWLPIRNVIFEDVSMIVQMLSEQAKTVLDITKHPDRTVHVFRGQSAEHGAYVGWRTGDPVGLDVVATVTV